jgi:hypothetical protein
MGLRLSILLPGIINLMRTKHSSVYIFKPLNSVPRTTENNSVKLTQNPTLNYGKKMFGRVMNRSFYYIEIVNSVPNTAATD